MYEKNAFEDILNLKYLDFKEKYTENISSYSHERKTIAFNGGNKVPSYSDDSDILIYYDCVNATQPLLVVERLPDDTIPSVEHLEQFIDMMNNQFEGYSFRYEVLPEKEYVDIIVVNMTIYNAWSNDEDEIEGDD